MFCLFSSHSVPAPLAFFSAPSNVEWLKQLGWLPLVENRSAEKGQKRLCRDGKKLFVHRRRGTLSARAAPQKKTETATGKKKRPFWLLVERLLLRLSCLASRTEARSSFMPLRWPPGKASRLALCARATEKERERRKSRKTLEIDETKKEKTQIFNETRSASTARPGCHRGPRSRTGSSSALSAAGSTAAWGCT